MKWHWSEDELEMQWSLSVEELALLPGRTDSGRLGFALLLKLFQFQGLTEKIAKLTGEPKGGGNYGMGSSSEQALSVSNE